jgi:hypothetical protein
VDRAALTSWPPTCRSSRLACPTARRWRPRPAARRPPPSTWPLPHEARSPVSDLLGDLIAARLPAAAPAPVTCQAIAVFGEGVAQVLVRALTGS